jgi:hypothetical protein
MRFRDMNLLAIAALLLPMALHAENFSYRNVDVAHFPKAEIDAGNIDVDGDGFQLRGSLPVYQNFFVLVEFQDLSFDGGIDTTRFMVGGGGHWTLNNKVDVIARAGVVQYEIDVGRFDGDDTGLFIGGRVRAMVAPQIEVEGGVEHFRAQVGGIENDTYLIGEARYNFTSEWSAGLLLTVGGDTSVFGVQGRFNF